jgi:TetR/AcrR family transcriptional regulator, repressor for uid operon
LYVYFASKEDLIAGITERDRSKLTAQLAEVATAPDLLAALSRLGEHYAVDEPRYKQQLAIEIGSASVRSGPVGEIFRACDTAVLAQFEGLFARAEAEGKIAPKLSPRELAQIIAVLGDGLFWRRAVDPNFDARAMVPLITDLIGGLLNPTLFDPTQIDPTVAPAAYVPAPVACDPAPIPAAALPHAHLEVKS